MRALRLPRVLFACSLLILWAAGGCRSAERAEPTAFPTATYTPRSTPLPTVATPPPPGTADNPIRLLFVRPAAVSRGAANNAAEALQTVLSESANLAVEVEIAESGADAVEALCASPGGTPAAAWVDGVTYAAAQVCADPSLAVVREDGAGADFVLIVPDDSEAVSVRDLVGVAFCRLSVDDLYTWIVPALVLQANSVSPTNLGTITDYGDLNELIDAVSSGDCAAAGINRADLESVGRGSSIRELGDAIPVPYSILMLPASIPLGVRNTLNDALLSIAGNADQAELLDPLLAQVNLVTVGEGDLDGWDSLLRRTRLNWEEMAR